MKKTLLTLSSLALAASANASLIITGVVDGGESGGTPKAIELYATSSIADLSAFSVGRYTNGGGTLSSETALPSVALAQGDFFYITGNLDSETILESAGFIVNDSYNSLTVASINGDDLIAITNGSGVVSDLFGQVSQGDTDFYQDSVALRNNSSTSPLAAGSLDAGDNFTITAWTNASDFAGQFGTYSPIPEPSTALLGGLTLLGLVRRRRA